MMQRDAPASPRGPLLRSLGWGHRGFRVERPLHAWLALLAILAIPIALDLYRAASRGMGDRYSDLVIWTQAAADFHRNPALPLYQSHPKYLYPPLLLILFRPLTELTPVTATVVFQCFKWLAVLLSLRFAWRLCSPPGEDVPPAVALGSLLLAARFLDSDVAIGNINTFIVCGSLGAALWVRRGAYVAAGALVGVLAAIKLTPALLLAYFVYKGWWKTLIGASVGLFISLFLIPASLIGWAENTRLLGEWTSHMPGAFASGSLKSTHTNQSITGVVNRLTGGSVAIPPDNYVTIVSVPEAGRQLLRAILSGGVLLAVGWIARRRFDPAAASLCFAAEISLVLIATLALSGLTWKAHFVALLPGLTVLLAYLADRRYPDAYRRRIAVMTVTAGILCIFTSDVITPRLADYAEAYGLILAAALMTAIGLTFAHRGSRGGKSPIP